MSAAAPSGPSPPSPTPTGGCGLVLVVMAILGSLGLACGALCGGVVYYVGARTGQTALLQPPSIQIPFTTPGSIAFSPPVNDWMSDRLLAPVYATALDAVTTNRAVIERLGEPIGSGTFDDDTLYRR